MGEKEGENKPFADPGPSKGRKISIAWHEVFDSCMTPVKCSTGVEHFSAADPVDKNSADSK